MYFKNMFKTFLNRIFNPDYILCKLGPIIPDRQFLKMRYRLKTGHNLNLKSPLTYNEKLQWLKLYNRKPEYSKMVDKYTAKQYVSSLIGEEFIIPTLGVWDKPEDIDFDSLPNQFVLKCTHDSGGIVICNDKTKFDKTQAIRKLNKALKIDFYSINREWPYKNVKHRIIAEKFLSVESNLSEGAISKKDLPDYKFYCFNGEPKLLLVATDRFSDNAETKFDFYDMEWNHLPIRRGHPNSNAPIKKPYNFSEMVEIAKKLSSGFPHIRVDLYSCNNKTYFGELTFFPGSGFKNFEPDKWNYILGEMLILPQKCS